MIVEANKGHYILRVPSARKSDVANLMAYRGLCFSTSASSRQEAVLFSPNPYSVADLGDCPELAAYRDQIELSRALDGVGSTRMPPGKELWDYQKATLDYLLPRGGGINGDQPGLGKTPVSIVFCNEKEAQRILVICPASVRLQWAERIKEWSTIPHVRVSTMLKVKDGIHPTANYQIISYDAARNPAIMKAIAKTPWDVLICDEAHKMKNMEALTTRAILGNNQGEYRHGEHKMPCIASHCKFKLALTGTLLLNRPSECLDGSTQVLTERGWVPIAKVQLTDRLWDGVEWVEHRGLLYQGCAPTVNVGQILATPTHRFLAKSTWASADAARQNMDLWSQILERGSANLPFNISGGIRAASSFANAVATAAEKLKLHYKNYVKEPLFAAGPVAQKMVRKRQTQNTMKFVQTLNYANAYSELCNPRETGAETQKTNTINITGGEAFECIPNGLRIARCGWRILFLYLDMKYRALNWIGLTTMWGTHPETFDLSPEKRIKKTNGKFPTFKGDWMLPWKKSKCFGPVYDIANAGPRQRFTVLSKNGPVISHNCYVLFRAFDHEAIDFVSEQGFKDRYNRQADMKTIEGKRFKLESTSLENELQNRLRVHIMARHEKKDVLKFMKPPRYSIVRCLENGAVKDALDAEGMLGLDIDEIQTTKDFEILGHIAEMRRLMGLALAPQIIDYAADFLEGSEEKLTIFAWHIDVLTAFEEGLSRFGTVRVDGQKSPLARQKAVDDFIHLPHKRVFLGNIQAAGTGLDGLQSVCSRCYLAEPDWVPAQNEQAVSRLDRIGQNELVNAEIFVAPGSISEKILVRALEKMNIIHRVLDQKGT